jgi:hypothetical protein
MADEAAKMATMEDYKNNPTLTTVAISGELCPDYTKKGVEWAKQEKANQLKSS